MAVGQERGQTDPVGVTFLSYHFLPPPSPCSLRPVSPKDVGYRGWGLCLLVSTVPRAWCLVGAQ